MRTLLAFGDSNTYGTPPMRTLEDDARLPPDLRWTGVCAAHLDGWRVVEDGLGGRTTVRDDPIFGGLLNGLNALPFALAAQRPDAVAIMLGTNDLKACFGLSGRIVAESLGRMIHAVRTSMAAPGRGVPDVLLILPPLPRPAGCLAEIFEGCEERGAQLAEIAPVIAGRMGAGFLDAGAHCEVSPVDGVHLDEAAHAALGRAVAEAIAGHR